MSDHEFENYLALLTRLLRLGAGQRDKIASELRTHLEDRLEELLGRGVPREEAVRLALEEFGDAAGLAGQFVSLSRNRRRRWLMRFTTFSVAAMVLIAAGITIFWPGRNAAPGVAAVIAQAPPAASKDLPQQDSAATGDRKIEEVLNMRMDVDYSEVPLKEVMARLTEQTGVTFHLSSKKLDEAAVSPDTPITIHFRKLRLRTLLDLMLGDLELTYVERDELIIITTPEDAESRLLIRIYDCRDVIGWPGGAPAIGNVGEGSAGSADGGYGGGYGSAAPGMNAMMPGGTGGGAGFATAHNERALRLMMIITASVDPQSWDHVRGPGSITDYYGLFVIMQTDATHRKVDEFLEKLRTAAGLDQSKGANPKVVR